MGRWICKHGIQNTEQCSEKLYLALPLIILVVPGGNLKPNEAGMNSGGLSYNIQNVVAVKL